LVKQILIVGLGNPGNAYSGHRHNLGFMVVDNIADSQRLSWTVNREKTLVCKAPIDSRDIILAKPQTYMNLSGKAVWPLIRRLNADPAEMIVVHDDLDLARGTVRIKVGGGDGGHKGIRSIADCLRFRDFIRVRLGIGRPPEGVSPEEFVLKKFSPDEAGVVRHLIITGVSAISLLVAHGAEHTRNIIHSVKLPSVSVEGSHLIPVFILLIASGYNIFTSL